MQEIIVSLAIIVVVLLSTLGVCSYLIYVERKLSAFMQDRIGPNRVGPLGLLQPLADGLKFLLKEDVIPGHVDRKLFILAPTVSVFTTLLAFSVVPFGPVFDNEKLCTPIRFIIAPNVDIGILFVFAISSLGVYGIILGGWASNNKYSLMGAMRASAQVISYEVPLGLSVLGVAALANSLNLEEIMHGQSGGIVSWYVWKQPVACGIFFTAALAESNRMPFDLPECEQELVGGYHTEYSALKFALFFLAEYTHVITISFLTAVLFFGGASSRLFAGTIPAVGVAGSMAVILSKVFAVIIVIMLLRWTIPRFRFDQLMDLAWKGLIPISLVNFVAVMVVKHVGFGDWTLGPISVCIAIGSVLVGLSLSASNRAVANVGTKN